jgi:hypothetical protein
MLSTSAELGAKVLRLGVLTTQMQLDQAVLRAVVHFAHVPTIREDFPGAFALVWAKSAALWRSRECTVHHLHEDALRICTGRAKEFITDTLGFEIVRFSVRS